MAENYHFDQIEKKWQDFWESEQIFKPKGKESKFYCLEMFPYPSGRLHMGHVRNYSIGDTLTRFLLMNGYDVLHPIGWDAFGLPAERAAQDHKTAPHEWTHKCIDNMKVQMKRLGFGYDWSREIATCEKDYYHWNQWLFLQMYKRGLAYRAKATVNWSEALQTILANEQVIDGKDYRLGEPVELKEIDSWFLKITAYADELLESCDQLTGWPQGVLARQKYWIGRSEGAEVDFPVEGAEQKITVFTTRPDTLFGAMFMVFAPEHPLIEELVQDPNIKADIEALKQKMKAQKLKAHEDRETEKEGVNTGLFAINPMTGEKMPIWVANFVLMEYGTGAIMSVPAHDQRDYEFAKKYDIPMRIVIQNDERNLDLDTMTEAYGDVGWMVNSGQFDGLRSDEGIRKVNEYLETNSIGKTAITYKLRDWGISRQRYWGCPIPMIECDTCGLVPVPEEDLPVELPLDVEIDVGGPSPLTKHPDFINVECPACGKNAQRVTETMDTFVDSSWYFLRYCSPREDKVPFNKEKASHWMPVDQYIGGDEHAILHLMYARFFHKVCRDIGLIDCDEPFANLLTQGMITLGGTKMSKSKGNIVDPDELVEKYGADTMRVFSLFGAPPERDLEWSSQGADGIFRFLNRVYHQVSELYPCVADCRTEIPEVTTLPENIRSLYRRTHTTIKRVTHDIKERMHLNTAIAAIMEFSNEIGQFTPEFVSKADDAGKAVMKEALQMIPLVLAPFAPHLAEELYQMTGGTDSIFRTRWPGYKEKALVVDEISLGVQVNGRLRSQISVPAETDEETIRKVAMEDEKIQKWTKDKQIVKVMVFHRRLVNVIVK